MHWCHPGEHEPEHVHEILRIVNWQNGCLIEKALTKCQHRHPTHGPSGQLRNKTIRHLGGGPVPMSKE